MYDLSQIKVYYIVRIQFTDNIKDYPNALLSASFNFGKCFLSQEVNIRYSTCMIYRDITEKFYLDQQI